MQMHLNAHLNVENFNSGETNELFVGGVGCVLRWEVAAVSNTITQKACQQGCQWLGYQKLLMSHVDMDKMLVWVMC